MDIATLQGMHPQWDLVDYKEAPNGGIWGLMRNGGIATLDSAGGTTGTLAPFLGSFQSAMSDRGRTETNQFQRLDVNKSGGYDLVSTNQQNYSFAAPPPPTPTVAPTTSTAGTTQATGTDLAAQSPASGSGAVHAVLDPLGLGSLADSAVAAMHSTPGADASWVSAVWLPQQDTYKKAFPEIAATQAQVAAGKDVHIPTPGEIVSFRDSARTIARQYQIPDEFVTNDQLGKLIVGGVSVPEFGSRILNGYENVMSMDPSSRNSFLAYNGLDMGHLAGFFLNPDIGEAAITRSVTQAQIGGAATRSGFGPITAEQASTLHGGGMGAAGAASAFGQAALQHPLTQELVGEGTDINQGTQLAAIGGSAAAQTEIEQRRQQRQAAFGGGGGAAGQGRGPSGLGAPSG